MSEPCTKNDDGRMCRRTKGHASPCKFVGVKDSTRMSNAKLMKKLEDALGELAEIRDSEAKLKRLLGEVLDIAARVIAHSQGVPSKDGERVRAIRLEVGL